MTKERKTVSLDPEVAAYLGAEGRNASETVNRLVKLDMGDEAVNAEIIRMRMDMEEDRYKEAAQKAKGHLQRYNQLKDRLEQNQQQKERERESFIAEAAEKLEPAEWYSSLSKEEQIPDADSEAVQSLAEQTDTTAGELRAEVVDYILTDGDSE